MTRIHEPAEPSRALGALAGQVDRLTKRLADTDRAVTSVQVAVGDIADYVGELARQPLKVPSKPQAASASVEWLTIDDPDVAGPLLVDLAQWLTDVWGHYGSKLQPCWPYHPAVVAELFAVRAAWLAATTDEAKPTALADWHERHRPGVADRISKYIRCENATGGHQAGGSGQARCTVRSPDLREVARWWALTHGATDDITPGLEIAS